MISTHVLDTWAGIPAAGVRVTLERQMGEEWAALGEALTDADGRVKELLAAGAPKQVGTYRLEFDTGAYFESRGVAAFHPRVTVEIDVRDATAHHHVPLLLGPYSYTTYRGS